MIHYPDNGLPQPHTQMMLLRPLPQKCERESRREILQSERSVGVYIPYLVKVHIAIILEGSGR